MASALDGVGPDVVLDEIMKYLQELCPRTLVGVEKMVEDVKMRLEGSGRREDEKEEGGQA